MEIGEKDIKNVVIGAILLSLVVAVFFLLKPILIAIVGGLLLAYFLRPIYKKILVYVKSPTASAFTLSALVLIITIIPFWFLIPIIMQQVFNIFSASQSVDFYYVFSKILPTAPKEFVSQMALSVTSFIGKASSSVLGSLLDSLLDLPIIVFNFIVAAFVFFFAVRDSEKLKEFLAGISPFNKNKEGLLIKQFRDITDSIVYGQILVGLVQGALAGIGFFMFGVSNALALTIIAIFFAMIPLVGPAFVWIPVNIHLFANSSPSLAIAYLIYNLAIVSTIDNVMRTSIVAKKSNLSPAIIIIGMIGGIFMFGVIGLVIGPLLIAYLITFVRAYRDKKLYALFYEE